MKFLQNGWTLHRANSSIQSGLLYIFGGSLISSKRPMWEQNQLECHTEDSNS